VGKHWTKEELKYIKKNCGILKDELIACKLFQLTGRICSGNAVRQMRAKLGIKKEHGRGVCRLAAKKPKEKKQMGLEAKKLDGGGG
jgi:hypothetical protein